MPSYAQEILADSPIAWWRLAEPVGTAIAVDEMGSYPGNIIGNPSRVASPLGGAGSALFLGAQYVDFGNVLPLTEDKTFSVEGWVKIVSWGTAWAGIITKGDSAWRIARNSTQAAVIQMSISSSSHDAAVNLATGAWRHFVWTYDGAFQRLYIDGALSNTGASTTNVSANTRSVRIGDNSEAAGRTLNGAVADFAVYNYALSANRIQSHYNAGSNSPNLPMFAGESEVSTAFLGSAPIDKMYFGNTPIY